MACRAPQSAHGRAAMLAQVAALTPKELLRESEELARDLPTFDK
jgi:hypothetical protein